MMVLGVLPALFVTAAVAALGCARHGFHAGRLGLRDALALALLAAGAWSAVGGELFSLGAHLTFWPVLGWWLLPTLTFGAYVYPRRTALRDWVSPTPRPDRVTCFLVAATAAILLATGLIALLTPPNTWDCLMYHLPRQVVWMDQGSLAHYPSHDLRQLEFPPMAESAGVQLMILAGGDWWANMVQWSAFLGCVLVASAIARDLGAAPRGQALAAFLAATVPAAIHQSVNPKNDLVVAFWACLLVYFAVRVRVEQRCGAVRVVCIGLALGLLLYTKGTGYIFALPVGVLLGAWMVSCLRLKAVHAAILIGVIAAALNAGHWWRNYDAFGHPLGRSAAGRGYALTNETRTPAAVLSTVVRNVALHTPTPSARLNAAQERWINGLHEVLGLDPNDRRITCPARARFAVAWTLNHDGTPGAPMHLLLALAAPVALALASRRKWDGLSWGVLAAGLGAFLAFCIVLKWQPWHARLHIPVAMLLAPVSGLVLSRAPGGPFKGVLVLAAFAMAVAAMLFNGAKPLVGKGSVLRSTREETLFRHDLAVRDAALAAAAAAAEFKPRIVGINPSLSGFEYAIQREFLDRLEPRPRIVSGRHNFGPAPPEGSPDPDVILAWHATGAAMSFRPGARGYVSVAQFLPLTVYAREHLVQAARRDVESMPFMGWRALEGLGPLEGPYPQFNLPVVRWANARSTRLEFGGVGPDAELVLECRRRSHEQTLEVLHNGRSIYRFEFPPEFNFIGHRIALTPREGPNEIEIRYGHTDRLENGTERAVQFRKIQIIPRAAANPPP